MSAERLRSGSAVALAALVACAVGAPLAAQEPSAERPAAPEAMVPVQVHRAMAPNGLLRIWNLAGSIHVVAWDRDSLGITGEASADEPFLCGGTVRALKCAMDVPMRDEQHASPARLEVRVPRQASVWLKSASAEISVEGIAGDLDAYSVTGSVRVDGAARNVAVETMGGDIQVRGSAATLRARTAGGAIALSGDAEDVDASSVSGDVALSGGHVRRGRFESIEGAVRWTGALEPGASLEFASHSGAIELRLPRATGCTFTISSYQGSVRNGFGPARLLTARDLKGQELSFTLAPPHGTRVTIRSFKGPVSLIPQ